MSNDLNYTLRLKDLFSKTMTGAMNQTKKMDGLVGGLGNKLAGLAAGASVLAFGKAVIESLKNYEYFSASLRTLMHGDKNAATALQGQLVELAKTTPFSLVDVQDSSRKLLAYGFAAGDIIKQMKMLGDVSAGTGNNISDVAYLYGTLRTQGKAMSKDIYQFTNRGINIIPQLAKQFKVVDSEVMNLARDSKISFKDVERAFTTMTSKGGDFFNMMNEQSQTIGGRLSNMGDAWEQLKVNIGKSQTGIIASTVMWASAMLDNLNKVMGAANRMDEAFSKAGVKLSLWQKIQNVAQIGNSVINPELAKLSQNRNQRLDESIQNRFVNPAGKDKISALTAAAGISKSIVSTIQAYQNKKLSKGEYESQMALLNQAKGTVSGLITNFSSVGGKGTAADLGVEGGTEGKAGKGSSSLGTGTSVSGNAPKNLTININKLVEELNVNTTNLQESSAMVKEAVSKALLEAVNDINMMER